MHRTEEACLVTCNVCGSEIWVERDRGYAIGPTDALCFDCAIARGGVFDEAHDRWTKAPNLEGVMVEAS